MLRVLINWWRGYSDQDMESVKERLSYSKTGGIYVSRPEMHALRALRIQRKGESSRKSKSTVGSILRLRWKSRSPAEL